MELYLEVIVGAALGRRFKLADGLKVGRRNCDVLLSDPKISSHHADIEARDVNGTKKFFILDNKSSNGIKFNEIRVPELVLTPGIEFRLGSTVLRVIDVGPPPKKPDKPIGGAKQDDPPLKSILELQPLPPQAQPKPKQSEVIKPARPLDKAPKGKPQVRPQAQKPDAGLPLHRPERDFTTPQPPDEIEMPETWRDILFKLIENAGLRADNVINTKIAAFNPPLRFRCVRGLDYGKTWILGYGPRIIGPKSLDLALKESAAPPICFEVSPQDSGVEFKTLFPQIVKLNGQELSSEILQDGDIIEIFNTQLVVAFYDTDNETRS